TNCAFCAFCGLSLFLYVERVDRVLVSQIQPATSNHRMRPRRQIVLLNSETSLFLVSRGRRLDEANHAILAETVKIPVGINQGTLAYAAIAPRDLTGVKLHRRQNRAREPIEVISNQHRTAVMILHVPAEPDLLRLVVRLDLDNTAASAVVRRDKHAIIPHNRCRGIRGSIRRLCIIPQQTAIFYVEPNRAFGSKEDHLRPAIYFQRNRRRITRLIALTLPNHGTVSLIQRYNGRTLPTGVHQQLVSHHEWRLADAPRDIRRTEFFQDVLGPNDLSGACIESR